MSSPPQSSWFFSAGVLVAIIVVAPIAGGIGGLFLWALFDLPSLGPGWANLGYFVYGAIMASIVGPGIYGIAALVSIHRNYS